LHASLPPSVRRLLDAGIDSLEKLEIVVAMRRAAGNKLSFSELRRATGLDRDDLRRSLRQLAAARMVTDGEADPVVLAPREAAEEEVLDELIVLYESDKTQLIIAITEIAMDRLRNLAGRAFADAFVIRKKSGGEDG
jgi:hypothetical protein